MLKKLFAYIVIGVILTVSPLYYINNVILSDKLVFAKSSQPSQTIKVKKFNVEVPDDAKCIDISPDQSYLSYVEGGSLYVVNTTDNSTKVIDDSLPVVYSITMKDRNLILFFSYDEYNSKLEVSTYNPDTQETISQKEFNVKDFQQIDDVQFSSHTNVIYINVETSNEFNQNKIYRINIMKTVSLYASNIIIPRMNLLENEDKLVYETSRGHVYIKQRLFSYNGDINYHLLGVDDNDNIYVLSADNMQDIIKIGSDATTELYGKLEDPNYSGIFSKNEMIYLIYDDHMYDVLNNKNINIKPDTQIINIIGDNIIYKTQDNQVTIEKK